MDAEEFFDDDFTVPVVLPNGVSAKGIFENQDAAALGVSTTAPQVSLIQADADVCRSGDPLTVNGVEYRVKNKDYSDEGIVVVHLETV
jgi:hypothetical protein